ncbi:hypothetical protein BDR07DRAFT_1423991 [Suillus spraguei]|nr:hypothetical protein BDR07DRAFT_1423991 [Suillus spraguei]
MYRRSRKMLIFLVVIFLVVNIFGTIFNCIVLKNVSVEEVILSGTYKCTSELEGNDILLCLIYVMLVTIWEILALCLASWTAVKHFRDLRQVGPSTGSIIGDCFTVLMKSHVVYFASFITVACFLVVNFLSPVVSTVPDSLESQIYPAFYKFS